MKRALLIMAAMTTLSAPALADDALAKSKNCMACHAVDKKLVGPSYKDVAKKYAGDAKAVDMLATKIMKGGSGVWGAIPMPANPQVNDADAKKLAAWILGQK
ncbi:c-type cytochrome [Hydrogenophaga sp. XSHU_21]